MTAIVLVHGGSHGSWCWERVVPLLEHHGHRVATPELPVDDVECRLIDWSAAVTTVLDDGDDDVVLVGHSMGGLVLPLAAGHPRVRQLVFLGALVPAPGRSHVEVLAEYPDPVATQILQRADFSNEGTLSLPQDLVRECFYGDCPTEVADQAWRRCRPQVRRVFTEPNPITTWPDVALDYVLMQQDRVVGPDWSRTIMAEWFNVRPTELPGSHSPFGSRPELLAETLLTYA